jgi:hypothetical protein
VADLRFLSTMVDSISCFDITAKPWKYTSVSLSPKAQVVRFVRGSTLSYAQTYIVVYVLTLCSASASTIYSTASNATDGAGNPISATVQFSLSGCLTGPSASCNLIIDITNTTANPLADTQEISGLSFALAQGTTALVSTGSTLSTAISNGLGGAATVGRSMRARLLPDPPIGN